MIHFFEYLGVNPQDFFKSAFEISLFALFLICLLHSGLNHGWKRTLREFSAGFFLTACCESMGVLSGAYVYPGFNLYVFSVPFVNPASWIALVYIIIEITNRLVYGRKALETYEVDGNKINKKFFKLFKSRFIVTILFLALIDSSLALGLDLVMDPLATVYNWWIWVDPSQIKVVAGTVDPYNFSNLTHLTTPNNCIHDFFAKFFPEGIRYPTRVFGIPLINFISWFVFVFVFSFQFRWVEFNEGWSEIKKTLVLWALVIIDIPLLSFILIAPNI
ncbi:carotenoid biosynthesis protein [Aureispira]|nr:carotenoid biosynthesis protein [Aureispira sp.]